MRSLELSLWCSSGASVVVGGVEVDMMPRPLSQSAIGIAGDEGRWGGGVRAE